MGGSPARESRVELGAGEHDHSHHIVQIAETEGSTDDEFDLIIGGLGAGIGEAEPGSGNDSREVALDFLAQFLKHGDSAPLGPGHPFGKGTGDLIRASLEGQTQIFLEEVGPIEFGIGLGKKLQLGLLVIRQMLRVFEQGIANVFYRLCLFLLRRLTLCRPARLAPGLTVILPAGLRPSLPAHLIQSVCGPGDHMEGVNTPLGFGAVFLHAGGNPPGSIC